MKNKVSILGTEYRIETHKVSEDDYLKERKCARYCCEESKLIVVADMSEKEYFDGMDEHEQEVYRKKVLRHEIIHTFLNESGLSDSANQFSGAWAKNEEMVDYFAIQSPKIFAVYAELGLVDVMEMLSAGGVAVDFISSGQMAISHDGREYHAEETQN